MRLRALPLSFFLFAEGHFYQQTARRKTNVDISAHLAMCGEHIKRWQGSTPPCLLPAICRPLRTRTWPWCVRYQEASCRCPSLRPFLKPRSALCPQIILRCG